MKKSFTEEDILRFLYNEMSIRESESFLDALYSDEDLWESFESYQHAVDTLVPLNLEPSENSVQNILEYISETQTPSFPVLATPRKPHHITMMAALVFATLFVITGSVYWVSQSGPSSPLTIGQTLEEPEMLLDSEDWEGKALEEELEAIRIKLEALKKQDSLSRTYP